MAKMARARALVLTLAAAAASGGNNALHGVQAATAKACTTLVDKSAPLYSALSLLKVGGADDQDLTIDEMLAPVDAAFPWLSKCIGSADILAVGMAALSDPSLTKCLGLVTTSLKPASSSSSSAASVSGQDLGALASLHGDAFGTSICPLLNETVMPCLDTIYTKTLPALIESGGSCCADMEAELKQAFGANPEDSLKSLTRRVGDMVCAVKTYKDSSTGESTNATCGQAWLETLGAGAFMNDLFKMAQIPNNQACAAMAGETFTTSSGDAYQLFKNQTAIDSCFAPVNLLLTEMSKLPVIAEMEMTDLFADGKCLKGQTVIEWAKEPNSTVKLMTDAIDTMLKTSMPNLVSNTSSSSSSDNVTATVDNGLEEMETQFANVCFHLPNSVSGCKYRSSIKFAFFTDASTQGESTTPVPTPSSAAITSSSSVLCAAITLAVFLASA